MVDALASGASGRKAVEVRVLSWAPYKTSNPLFYIGKMPYLIWRIPLIIHPLSAGQDCILPQTA